MMREGTQIGYNRFDALDTILHVLKNFRVFLLLVLRDILYLVPEGVEACRRKIERVVNFMDNARTHTSKRSQLLRLHELSLGVLELLDRIFQDLVLLGKLP